MGASNNKDGDINVNEPTTTYHPSHSKKKKKKKKNKKRFIHEQEEMIKKKMVNICKKKYKGKYTLLTPLKSEDLTEKSGWKDIITNPDTFFGIISETEKDTNSLYYPIKKKKVIVKEKAIDFYQHVAIKWDPYKKPENNLGFDEKNKIFIEPKKYPINEFCKNVDTLNAIFYYFPKTGDLSDQSDNDTEFGGDLQGNSFKLIPKGDIKEEDVEVHIKFKNTNDEVWGYDWKTLKKIYREYEKTPKRYKKNSEEKSIFDLFKSYTNINKQFGAQFNGGYLN